MDGSEISEGDFLAPCATNTDCLSGFCVQGPDGKFCTRQCLEEEDCPPDFQCVGIVLTYPDLTFLCVQKIGKLCSACSADEDCILDGARCIELKDGNFCGQGCEGDDCPLGYECQEVEGGNDQCIPQSETCSCTGEDPNIIRSCSVTWEDPDNPDAPTYTCSGVQNCEAGGWGPCQLAAEECDGQDNDCNGQTDEGFLDTESGKYIDDENCGVCGNNCTFMQLAHGSGICDKDKAVPDCMAVCDDNFFDVDGNLSNGCECQFLTKTDFPGSSGEAGCETGDCSDANCDGIDGEVDGGVFVAKYGSDSNPGTIDSPLLTVQSGIDQALNDGKRDVYVATGVYVDPVHLKAGVGVYGGYSADFVLRDPLSYETVVLGGQPEAGSPGAVNALGIQGGAPSSTVISGFVVFGFNSKATGASSYALYVKDSDVTLRVSESRIVGGDGGDGLPGLAGNSGLDGKDGLPGLAAYDIGKANCSGGDHNSGGSAGKQTCGGVVVDGGGGGNAICPDWDENDDPKCPDDDNQSPAAQESGGNGENNAAGTGLGGEPGLDSIITAFRTQMFGDCQSNLADCGLCTVPGASQEGSDAQSGQPGTDGGSGSGCTEAGKITGDTWVPFQASGGGSGTHGGGGGGGGAAGGVETHGCQSTPQGRTDIGGSGGGGGSGGCAATGGTGGGSGGGSFGVFVVYTVAPATLPTLDALVIEPGRGGNGGNGGIGGVGGKGGDGASGGSDAQGINTTFCTSGGGHGGAGGSGGHGSGGGGGCGGPAHGLFVYGASSVLTDAWKSADIQFQGSGVGGSGGLGGASLGSMGVEGADGTAANTNF